MYIWQELRTNIKGPLWFLTLVYKIARLKFHRWIYAVHRFAWNINLKHQKSETLSKELMCREEKLTGGFFRTGLAHSGWSCKQKEKYDDDDDNCGRMQSHCEAAEKMWITGNREMGRCATVRKIIFCQAVTELYLCFLRKGRLFWSGHYFCVLDTVILRSGRGQCYTVWKRKRNVIFPSPYLCCWLPSAYAFRGKFRRKEVRWGLIKLER